MNDDHLPDDDVLRLVFGELDAERQAAVRKAVAEDAELAATARGLEAAVVAVRVENVGQVSDDFNDRLRRRMPDIFDCTQAESARPTFLTRSLDTWRWIMRSPVSRVTAAAIFVLAVTGVAVWFHGSGATPAFADFLEPILEAKTVRYKVTT
jgi:anti-sigma factor RsiW